MAKSKSPTKPKSNGKKPSPKRPKGCYVLSLTVENIRCFGPKQTLLCSDEQGRPKQWTVILGDNGTGKTTLLLAIASHQFRLNACDIPDSAEKTMDRCIWFYHHQHSRDRVASSALTAIEGFGFEEQDNDNLPLQGKWAIYLNSTSSSKSDLYSFLVYGYGNNRGYSSLVTESRNGRSAMFDGVETLFYRDATLVSPQKWLFDLELAKQINKDKMSEQWLQFVRSVFIGIPPGTGLLPGVTDIKITIDSGPVPIPVVQFHTEYGWVPLNQLGHGYQTMIAWVTDFVSRMVERYPESENPLAEPAVCLVDEIDLHMHPVWQRKVIGYLSERFPNTQFIVTAHSPLVVQAAASVDANIVVLARSQEQGEDGNYYVEIRNNPEDVRNWRLDQILTSDLFGVGLRSQKIDRQIERQQFLLNLPHRNPQEEAELAHINAQIDAMPIGDSEKFASEIKLLQEAISALQAEKKS